MPIPAIVASVHRNAAKAKPAVCRRPGGWAISGAAIAAIGAARNRPALNASLGSTACSASRLVSRTGPGSMIAPSGPTCRVLIASPYPRLIAGQGRWTIVRLCDSASARRAAGAHSVPARAGHPLGQLARADLARAVLDGAGAQVRRQVVVVALEAVARDA